MTAGAAPGGSPAERIAAIVAGAPAYVPPEPQEPEDHAADGPGDDGGADDPPAAAAGSADEAEHEVIRACAALDHSDTDNAERLIRHFGRDMAVLAQEGTPGGDWLAWSGTHWDLAGGAAAVRLIAQQLGPKIMREAFFLVPSESEAEVLARARALKTPAEERSEADRALLADAARIEARLSKRRQQRRAFGVTSKNKGRMESALDCAAPRLRRPPDAFNPNRLRLATQSHTLTLARLVDQDVNPDGSPRFTAALTASPGHAREDWITSVLPQPYDPAARSPRWRAFLARMLPNAEKRRTVQQFCGLGLLAIPVQYVMFHYGLGANGKSVFLETLVRVLGPGLAVGLPRESIVGGSERSAGGASPDLVRLYGKRMVRILEVKGNVPLQEDLIKRLTGGEAFPVRTLFKGYFEFQSVATPHMSGNGKPSIDGTDNGIWRRMLLVHWDQVFPPHERRDLEEVVSEFCTEEGPGILNWLIEGALDYLAHGLVIAPSVVDDTQEYRDEMDPIGMFAGACVWEVPLARVAAGAMYEAYVSWSQANAKKPASMQKFGRVMGERFHKSEIGGRVFYHDCALHDVPARPDEARSPLVDGRD